VAENAKNSGVKHFVFTSTVKVYGNSYDNSKLRDESSECFPEDAYGRSKLAAEIELKKMENDNFTVSIIRTPLIYGYGVKANMNSLIKLIDFFPVLPFDKISNKRNFTYIENLVGFIDRIIEKRASGTFIAMDDNPVSTTELVRFLSKSLQKKTVLFKPPGFVQSIVASIFPDTVDRLFGSLEFDNNMTKQLLDYYPPFSTEEGIRKMVYAYKNREQN
jgi:nucleoside-diphosphate-sugar epimerase